MSNIDIKDVVAHIKEEFIIPPEPRETKTEAKDEDDKASATEPEADKTSEPPRKKQKLTGHKPGVIGYTYLIVTTPVLQAKVGEVTQHVQPL
ncbi:hypothetical protein E2C01_017685 [Portunus trituberculatus]|uniref:Uncharacterized protein n=1 Tax=Portunus trituberculatus TaxID=210409 RepID=A0A5B7DU65_PORTR|nr:hypothetical protein [Portunus trituberculatus]